MRILDATFIASAQSIHALPPAAFAEVAFAGRSNVGKSSLINRLVNRRKLVRTSSTPGCTRGINLFRIKIDDATVDFVDLPGYGYAKRSKSERVSWGPLIEGYLRSRENLRAVVVIVDIRRGIEEADEQLLEFLAHIERNAIVVATKIDKLAVNKQKVALEQLKKESNSPIIGFSAETGVGSEPLLKALIKETIDR